LVSWSLATWLNMNWSYMWYYNWSSFTVYIQSNWNFYFGWDATKYISWNWSTLTIRWSLNADDITAGTLTGRTLQTASSWQRVVVDSVNNRITFYNSSGTSSWYIEWNAYSTVQALTFTSTWYIVFDAWYSCVFYDTILCELLEPTSDATYDLGTSSYQFRNAYISWNLYINWYIFDESSWYPRRQSNYIPYYTWTAWVAWYMASSSWWSTTLAVWYVTMNIWWTNRKVLYVA
jgi:hypothetical protein